MATGDVSVGKTTLITRYIDGTYKENPIYLLITGPKYTMFENSNTDIVKVKSFLTYFLFFCF